MQVRLSYGKKGLTVDVPDEAVVVAPLHVPGLMEEQDALAAALAAPIGAASLAEAVSVQDSVVVVFSDITRPVPNDRILPPLLRALAHIPDDQITLLNALGTHRSNTEAELDVMLGADLAHRYRIVQHDAWNDDDLIDLGETSFGHRALVNRHYVEAGYKILTGFIEPHFFAGFSGGPKAVLPGVAGIESIMGNHGYEMLSQPGATWGSTYGNPVWEEIRQVAAMTHPDFLLNVTLNSEREIKGIYAGDVWAAHKAGTHRARTAAMAPVNELFDIVITTNSGYPLDMNLYQAVKGMSAAAQIVKPGGAIIMVAECSDGIPDYGEYRNLVREAGSVEGIMEMISQPGFRRHDQWEAQLQARVQQRAEVFLFSDGLSTAQTHEMLLTPCSSIEETLLHLQARYGRVARICVLPEGPQTIPYLAQ